MQTKQIDEFLEFSKNAQTRAGVPFKLKSYQKGQDGSISSVKGIVKVKTEAGNEVEVDSLWEIPSGKNYTAQGFDLVEDIQIEE